MLLPAFPESAGRRSKIETEQAEDQSSSAGALRRAAAAFRIRRRRFAPADQASCRRSRWHIYCGPQSPPSRRVTQPAPSSILRTTKIQPTSCGVLPHSRRGGEGGSPAAPNPRRRLAGWLAGAVLCWPAWPGRLSAGCLNTEPAPLPSAVCPLHDDRRGLGGSPAPRLGDARPPINARLGCRVLQARR